MRTDTEIKKIKRAVDEFESCDFENHEWQPDEKQSEIRKLVSAVAEQLERLQEAAE